MVFRACDSVASTIRPSYLTFIVAKRRSMRGGFTSSSPAFSPSLASPPLSEGRSEAKYSKDGGSAMISSIRFFSASFPSASGPTLPWASSVRPSGFKMSSATAITCVSVMSNAATPKRFSGSTFDID